MTAGVNAEDDFGAGWDFQAEALRANGDAAVVADFDQFFMRDEGNQGSGREGSQNGWIYRFGTDSGRRAGPAAGSPPPSLPCVRLRAALGLRPRRALSSAEAEGA